MHALDLQDFGLSAWSKKTLLQKNACEMQPYHKQEQIGRQCLQSDLNQKREMTEAGIVEDQSLDCLSKLGDSSHVASTVT